MNEIRNFNSELYGLKQIAPILGYSIRQAQRLIKTHNIALDRAGKRGHIRMTLEKVVELKRVLGIS